MSITHEKHKNYKYWYKKKSMEWTTPGKLFKELDNEFNFTLDPCSTHSNALCFKHYTIEEDGLNQDWSNEIVFMNPTYGREISKWIKKAYLESLNNATVVCLLPCRTDTRYWHEYILMYAKEIRYIKGRLKYGNSKINAPFSSAIVVFSSETRKT